MSEGKKLLGTIFVRCRRLSIFCFHIVVGFLLLKLYFMLIEFRMRANNSTIICFHSLVTSAIIGPAILLYSEAFHNSYCKQLLPNVAFIDETIERWTVFEKGLKGRSSNGGFAHI